MNRKPNYVSDADYTTNAPDYYDDLARKQKLLEILSKRVYDYDKTLNNSLENIKNVLDDYVNKIDHKIGEGFNDEINELLVQWVNDGTLEHIINVEIFKTKADTLYVDKMFLETITDLEDRGINVRSFAHLEVDGDFSPVVQAAMDSGHSIIEFPSWIKTLKEPIIVPKTVKEIRFNSAYLKYSKEQSIVAPTYKESMFVVDGVDDFKHSGGKLEYTGTFDHGSSYGGRISAFYILDSDNYISTELEAFGFNNSGINIAPSKTDEYCMSPIIEKNHLHHNRIGGLSFGNTDGIIVEKNRTEYNGIATDSGTGYGICAWRSAYPKNSTIINNKANYNFRKGIDFHSGFNGFIESNFCIGNWQYGIFVQLENISVSGSILPIGEWKITNNIVRDMKQKSFEYATIYGIVVGTYEQQKEKTSFILEGNSIINIEKDTIFAMPIYVSSAGLVNSTFTMINNIVDVGNVSSLVRFQGSNLLGQVDVKISGNKLRSQSVESYPINLLLTSRVRKVSIIDNNIEVVLPTPFSVTNWGDFNSSPEVKDVGLIFKDNELLLTGLSEGRSDVITGFSVSTGKTENNNLNGTKQRNWDGFIYTMTSNTYIHEGMNWTRGSIIYNRVPNIFGVAGSRYLISSWFRVTTGYGNVLGVDWLENKMLTDT